MAKSYCVYIHTSPNRKKYIGITKQSTKERWRNGFGYRGNSYFFNAIIKYGWDNFTHEIYADNLSRKEACELEKRLIKLYDTKNKLFGYNHTNGGDGTSGFFLSDLTKKKISESRLELCKDEKVVDKMREVNPNKKKVYQYSVDGILIKIWNSARQAEKEINPNKKSQAIRKCCSGDCKCAYGFVWSYEPLDEIPELTHYRKVYQYSLDGKLIQEWYNLKTAINEFRQGSKSSVISQCVTGHRPKAYDFIWSYDVKSEVI